MTHEIEVKVKVEGVAGEIVFFVSDMPKIESSVKRNLANFDNWLYAKWSENGAFHCIEAKAFQSIHSRNLANDTIRIALNTAGYNVAEMNQFERASAILDMAQELAALTDKRQCNARCTDCQDTLCGNYEGVDKNMARACSDFLQEDISQENFDRITKESTMTG